MNTIEVTIDRITSEVELAFINQASNIDVTLDCRTNVVEVKLENTQKGEASKWEELENKPFNSLSSSFSVNNGVLDIKKANASEEDNTLPITSAAVYTEIGNINILLSTI